MNDNVLRKGRKHSSRVHSPANMPSKAEMRAWKERWRIIGEYLLEEARAVPFEQRLRDLDMLGRWGHSVGWPDDESEVNVVRQRWVRLKQLCHVR